MTTLVPKSWYRWTFGILACVLTGCVEVPDAGITPPNYSAQIRIIYADPALQSSTLSIADGPTFASYSSLPAGAFGSASDYTTLPAGAKRVIVKRADGTSADPDTSIISFGTETVTSLIVMPRRLTADVRIRQIGERYTFATPGIVDSTLVRFVNCLATKDTVDLWRIRGSAVPGIASDNLRYDRSTAFFNVPKDSTWRFYVTRYTGSTAGIGDTTTIVGSSKKQFTIILSDSLSRIRTLRFEDR